MGWSHRRNGGHSLVAVWHKNMTIHTREPVAYQNFSTARQNHSLRAILGLNDLAQETSLPYPRRRMPCLYPFPLNTERGSGICVPVSWQILFASIPSC